MPGSINETEAGLKPLVAPFLVPNPPCKFHPSASPRGKEKIASHVKGRARYMLHDMLHDMLQLYM